MRREGSPWTGLWAVVMKELADHLSSVRMQLLEGLIFLTALGSTYGAVRQLKASVAEDPYLYLKLFTTAQDPLPSFVAFLGFFLPLAAIALGFDSINGEHNRHTLSRVLSQPIYRDALLLGKFLAGMFTLGVSLLALWLLVTGMGLLVLGVVPGIEEEARGLLLSAPGVGVGPAHKDGKKIIRTNYLLPFEIVSVHLLVVLIGAAYLARAKRRRRTAS